MKRKTVRPKAAADASSAGAAPGPASGNSKPDREEIARLAYSYWEARGCQDGSAEEDWIRAEQELRIRN